MMTAVNVDAHPIAWREAGSGPLAVFLHGLGGSRTAWEPQLSHLADLRRCIAWDMPGYGASSGTPDSFETIARSAAVLIESLGGTADVVGLSLGGMIAQHLAVRYPERVRSLVLLDTSPAFGLDGTTAEEWLALRLGPLKDGVEPDDLAPKIVDSIIGPHATDVQRAEAVEAMQRISASALRAACRTLVTHDLRPRLGQITVPALVVVGRLDEETPVSYATALTDAIPTAKLHVIDGVGHLSNLEAPQEINSLIRAHWGTLPVRDLEGS